MSSIRHGGRWQSRHTETTAPVPMAPALAAPLVPALTPMLSLRGELLLAGGLTAFGALIGGERGAVAGLRAYLKTAEPRYLAAAMPAHPAGPPPGWVTSPDRCGYYRAVGPGAWQWAQTEQEAWFRHFFGDRLAELERGR